jgi:hypothetical protein
MVMSVPVIQLDRDQQMEILFSHTTLLGSPSRNMKQLKTVRRIGTMYLADNSSTVLR